MLPVAPVRPGSAAASVSAAPRILPTMWRGRSRRRTAGRSRSPGGGGWTSAASAVRRRWCWLARGPRWWWVSTPTDRASPPRGSERGKPAPPPASPGLRRTCDCPSPISRSTSSRPARRSSTSAVDAGAFRCGGGGAPCAWRASAARGPLLGGRGRHARRCPADGARAAGLRRPLRRGGARGRSDIGSRRAGWFTIEVRSAHVTYERAREYRARRSGFCASLWHFRRGAKTILRRN